MSLASLSGIFGNAASGMRSAQAQLDIVARNVSNAGTAGYTRKEAPLQTLVADGSAYGVTAGEVTRSVSRSLLQELRAGESIAAQLAVAEDFLAKLELSFGTPGDESSIATAVGKIGDAFRDLINEPNSSTLQQQVLQRAKNFATSANALSETIQSLRSDADSLIASAAETFNVTVRELAELNRSIAGLRGLGKSTADLEDRRDALLKSLAELVDIRTFERPTGEIVVTMRSGREILDAGVGQLSFNPTPVISPDMELSAGDLSPVLLDGNDISAEIKSGRLRGLLDIRDKTMVDTQAQLDELTARIAQNLALADLDLFSYGAIRPVITSVTAGATLAKGATTLTVSSAAGLTVGMNLRFANHPTTYRVTAIVGLDVTIAPATGAGTGADTEVPSGTRMVFAEPPGTAANGFARIVGVNPAVISAPWRLRDGTSVATIGSIAQNNAIPRAVVDSFERVQPFGTGAGSSGLTLTGYAGSLIVAQATAKNGASEALQARERLNEQFERRYSGESAVNVDRELALMLEIQNSYAASAKVLTAARQLMDELLAMMR